MIATPFNFVAASVAMRGSSTPGAWSHCHVPHRAGQRKPTLSVILGLMTSMVLGPAAAAAVVHAAPNAWAALDQASRSFDAAQYQKDVPDLGIMVAPEMVYINGSGKVGGKADFIAVFSAPAEKFEPFVITDRRVILFGPTAGVATADGVIRGTDAGKPFSDHFRYSDTFALRDGHWRVVYVQVTRLPKP